jgi:hypothetical protein
MAAGIQKSPAGSPAIIISVNIDALTAAEVHRVVAARPGPEAADREARL